uniref:Uncharacterized protein n=1 Tax=Rhizophora mucronata TaxID=61149 RepID=A0A2P2MWD7_RHIMU
MSTGEVLTVNVLFSNRGVPNKAKK